MTMIRLVAPLLTLLVLGFARVILAAVPTTYYVANSIGADTNAGTTTGAPFKTIKHALAVAIAGDTICINDDSNYTQASGEAGNGADSAVVDINAGGTAGNPLTLKACNGHTPVIEHGVTNQQFYGIRINAQWVTVGPGITVYGGSDQKNSKFCMNGATGNCQLSAAWCLAQPSQASPCIGSGINVAASHVTITGVTARYNASCGICANPIVFDGRSLDYITFDHNVSYNNAWYSVSGSSGFSFYQLTNSDTAAGYHIRVTNNYAWGNRMFLNETSLANQGSATGGTSQVDGNGLIIDDCNHAQHSTQGPAYTGAVLVENNIFSFNGGTGAHAFSCSAPVDIAYNTIYHDNQSWPNRRQYGVAHTVTGESCVNTATHVRFYNNIIVSDPRSGFDTIGAACSSCTSGDYNIQTKSTVNGAAIAWQGAHDILNVDPKITNPLKGNGADWRLRAGSPAAGAGNASVIPAPATDFYGQPRDPVHPSIGAAEVGTL